eukprot:gnl/TRDRNA2_/TRDRNA2_168176_c1_seq1.p1 gnl/TRDRNA2_/TRDRNA2_168176_c1~~gnl/TRDRNA2_/TRDRNA2_168176_c1_seq1.p1  ORF type:complete len:371 (-),score=81.60 gnl/TRDRNA2_/TRDRNA2_168176_c1_seq1:103-1215(-)
MMRVVRIFHLVKELQMLVASIFGSMKSLFWTMVLLSLVLYIIGVVFTQVVVDHYVQDPLVMYHYDDGKEDRRLKMYFGSVMRSVLSLYMAMSGGINWDDIATPMMNISPLMTACVVAYIAFAVLCLMNLVTGVFVQFAMESAREEDEEYMVQNVYKLFMSMDMDNSGTLSWSEFQAATKDPEMSYYFRAVDIDVLEAQNLFRLLDIDDAGEVEYMDFLDGCLRLKGPAKALDLFTVMIEGRRRDKRLSAFVWRVERDLVQARQERREFSAHLYKSLAEAKVERKVFSDYITADLMKAREERAAFSEFIKLDFAKAREERKTFADYMKADLQKARDERKEGAARFAGDLDRAREERKIMADRIIDEIRKQG